MKNTFVVFQFLICVTYERTELAEELCSKQTRLSKVYLPNLQLCYLLKFRIGETPELKS